MENSEGPTSSGVEDRRAEELARLHILDTPPEAEYDRIVALAAEFFEAPIALVALVDRERLWFKARVGFVDDEAHRELTFCHHTVTGAEPLVVCDATADARFRDNPLVTPADGLRFYAGVPLLSSSGLVLGTVCVFDVCPRPEPEPRQIALLRSLARLIGERLEARPAERRRRIALELTRTSPDAMVCADVEGRITDWNAAAIRLFGWTEDEALGRSLDLIVPPRYAAFHRNGFHRLVAEAKSPRLDGAVELAGLHRDGHEVSVELSLALWRDGNDAAVGAIIRDVSERRRNEDRLRWLAHYDLLTGTPNRATLAQDLGARLALVDDGRVRPFTLAMLDLDGFKDVNDTLGHSTGDMLLKHVADRLVASLGTDGTAYRLGGDEFALLLGEIDDPAAAARLLSRAQSAVARPLEIEGVSIIDVEASIGFALAPNDGTTAEELVSNADLALYRAKRGRTGIPCRFSPDLRAAVTLRRTLDTELRLALQNDEFELYYQPQVDYALDLWVGAEALLRWNHPTRGLLAPDAFMATLEASTLSGQVGSWVLRAACLQAAAWRRIGLGFATVSVNLFASQLRNPRFLDEVAAVLAEADLPPWALELEITEKIALSLDETPLHTLHGLHDLGVKLAFDDFGTGYASLSALKRYPVDRLKIDRSFVRDLPHDESDAAIVSSIVAITTALGLDLVAEGVETEEQRDYLIRRGCFAGQGFLHGRPMPADAIERLCRIHPSPTTGA